MDRHLALPIVEKQGEPKSLEIKMYSRLIKAPQISAALIQLLASLLLFNVAPSDAFAQRTGEQIYETSCLGCHGTGTIGAPRVGEATRREWDARLEARRFEMLLYNAKVGYNAHPPKGACFDCSDQEISKAIQYMLSQSGIYLEELEGYGDAEEAGGSDDLLMHIPTNGGAAGLTVFDENKDEIAQFLINDSMRSIGGSRSSSSSIVRGARGRMIAAQGCVSFGDKTSGSGGASDEDGDACNAGTLSNTVQPLDIDGSASVNASTVSTSGIISGETSYNYGQTRRIIFGDFDIQHDNDTGSTIATLTGRVTWEQILQSNTLLGYFVGLEYVDSQMDGTFVGDQTRIGLNFGGYAVQRVAEQLYADGYLSIGFGKSDLQVSNGKIALQSDYSSQTVTAGAALWGFYAYEQYEFRPELAIYYGRTELGKIGFTGTAYGITNDTLSLDAGSVTIVNLSFRPEIFFAIDDRSVAQSRTVMSFAPRLICEETSSTLRAASDSCGGGAEIGFEINSFDGLRRISFRTAVDEIGNTRRLIGNLGIDLRF